MSFRLGFVFLSFAAVTFAACGPSPFAKSSPASDSDQAKTGPTAHGPITPGEWKDLCEAEAERARRCPGPAPDSLAICTDTAACVGAVVRPEVIRELWKCQATPDCRRVCSIERSAATLPRSPAIRDLEEACAMRRTVCPALDCNTMTRPVRALDESAVGPLVECLRYEHSCLDAANCYLDKMTPVITKLSECAPGEPGERESENLAGAGDAGRDAGRDAADAH